MFLQWMEDIYETFAKDSEATLGSLKVVFPPVILMRNENYNTRDLVEE